MSFATFKCFASAWLEDGPASSVSDGNNSRPQKPNAYQRGGIWCRRGSLHFSQRQLKRTPRQPRRHATHGIQGVSAEDVCAPLPCRELALQMSRNSVLPIDQ
jgi:hypothetical protein